MLLVQNYTYASFRYDGVFQANESLRLKWQRDPKDDTGFKFDIVNLETVIHRVHVIPDFSEEGFFFVNSEIKVA